MELSFFEYMMFQLEEPVVCWQPNPLHQWSETSWSVQHHFGSFSVCPLRLQTALSQHEWGLHLWKQEAWLKTFLKGRQCLLMSISSQFYITFNLSLSDSLTP